MLESESLGAGQVVAKGVSLVRVDPSEYEIQVARGVRVVSGSAVAYSGRPRKT